MRKIGLMPVWGRAPFVMPALMQATSMLVDDLYVSVCCLHPEMQRFEDDSEEIARAFAKGVSIAHYVKVKPDYKRTFAEGMVHLLNSLLEVATPEENDLIWLLDVDEFYETGAISQALEYSIEHPDFTSVRFSSRFVCPDTSHYVEHAHTRLHRYWEGRRFASESMFIPVDESVVLGQYPMYHYSLAVPADYKETFWRIEYGLPTAENQEKKCRWWREIYLNYDVEDEEIWMRKNEELTGHHGFWFGDDCRERPGGGLKKMGAGEGYPHVLWRSGLLDKLGDFREFFGGEKPAPRKPAPVVEKPVEPPRASADRTLRIGSAEKETTPLLAGPWAGELGYELMFWIPVLKAMSQNFEKLTAIVPRGHEMLYQHVTQSIITHRIDLGENRWRANAGDSRFWFGEWADFADQGALNELAEQLQGQIAASIVIEPIPELFKIPGEFVRYGDERPRCGIAIHCRRAGHGRDWPAERFDSLATLLNDEGITPRIIGTTGDYLPKGAAVIDEREPAEESIGRTIEHICSTKMVVGASSGVMHLASLCGIPHLVWGDEDFPIPEIGTSKEAYEMLWNPFGTKVRYICGGWFPEVREVCSAVLSLMKEV